MDSSEKLLRVIEKSDRILDAVMRGGLFYSGMLAAKKVGGNMESQLLGGTTALVSLKLAQSANIPAGAAGVAGLGLVGILNLNIPSYIPDDPPIVDPTNTGIWGWDAFLKGITG